MAQNDSRGVAGVCDEDGAGVLVDLRFDLLAVSVAVTLLRRGRDGADVRAAGVGHGGVVGIERLGDENLVAVIQNALERDAQRLAAANGDVNIVRVKVHIELGIVAADGLDQLGDTGRGRIGQYRRLKCLDCLEECRRGLNVGLTDVQMIDVDAACLCCHCVGVEFTHW